MAQQALGAGPARRRVLFGLLDADGWTWATIKAAIWLVVMIMLLGYIPDRAYYFTVFSTIEIGLNPQAPPASWVTPINLCPAENGGLPCPAPTGAVIPWQPSPSEIDLPAGRTDGSAIQVGTKLLYIGGSDGTAPSADVFVADIVGGSTFDRWSPGPALPAPRANAAAIYSTGSIYLIGGVDAAGVPQTTVWSLSQDPDTGAFKEWTPVEALALEEGRAGAAVVAASDGLILVGGAGPSGPSVAVWKSSFDSSGALGAWVRNADLLEPRVDANAALVGDFLWVYGGSDAGANPSATVQRGSVATPEVAPGAPAGTRPDPSFIQQWSVVAGETNLPVARTNAAGFTANGAIYLVGGSDGSTPAGEVYWAVPTADGEIERWRNEPVSNLPAAGLAGGAPVVSGSTAFVIGGTTEGGLLASSVRAGLAPQKPFFQVGLLGVTIPALKIEGEVGQQLGYLNAAGAGTAGFIVLLLVGWVLAHRTQARALWRRIVRR
jgi:N-acetylneuraminic acid mutarotase